MLPYVDNSPRPISNYIPDILSEDGLKDSVRFGYMIHNHRRRERNPTTARTISEVWLSLESSMLSLCQDSLDRKKWLPISISRHDPSPGRGRCLALQVHVISKLTLFMCVFIPTVPALAYFSLTRSAPVYGYMLPLNFPQSYRDFVH